MTIPILLLLVFVGADDYDDGDGDGRGDDLFIDTMGIEKWEYYQDC